MLVNAMIKFVLLTFHESIATTPFTQMLTFYFIKVTRPMSRSSYKVVKIQGRFDHLMVTGDDCTSVFSPLRNNSTRPEYIYLAFRSRTFTVLVINKTDCVHQKIHDATVEVHSRVSVIYI